MIKRSFRPLRYVRPTQGLEYNKLHDQWLFSYKIHFMDIAHTPYVAREHDMTANVNANISKINLLRIKLDRFSNLVKGRR